METKIGNDIYSLFYDILGSFEPKLEKENKVDLFLYSTGGVTIAGFSIANLLKEYVNNFNVIIPYKAYSAGTLLALGAQEIIMSKLGQLTPIDPSVNSPYNPVAPSPPGVVGPPNFLSVSVEDCIGYIKLAKKEAGLEKDLKDVFLALSQNVRPMALGSVYRAREQIKLLANKLLNHHIEDSDRKERIINALTEELLSHDYFISKTEAKQIGLNIVDCDDERERLMWDIYSLYADDLKINDRYNPEKEIGGQNSVNITTERAYIENVKVSYSFMSKKILERVNITRPGGIPETAIRERILFEGWEKN